jgi:hypothetical protein
VRLLDLGQGLGPGQDVVGAEVSVVGERANGDGGDIALVDQRAGRLTVGPAYDAGRSDLVGPHQGVGGEPGRLEERPLGGGPLDGALDGGPEGVGPAAGGLGGEVDDASRVACEYVDSLLRRALGKERPEQEHGLHAVQMPGEATQVQDVAGHDVDAIWWEVGGIGITGQRPHRRASVDQPGHHVPAHLAGSSDDEDHAIPPER